MAAPITHDDLNDLIMDFKFGSGIMGPDLWIHLFVNNMTPDCHSTSPTDMTECTDPSYTAQHSPGTDWTISDYPLSGDCGKQAVSHVYTFSFSVGGFTVYGMWVYDLANGRYWWVQKFDAPFLIPSGGGAITVQLTDKQQQCT
jgi:hypothetical protein